jgi:hypothetical protein
MFVKILEQWREGWHALWEKVTKTRYTQALEAEVARLRAENRAMLNSILGIAGVPPIAAQESEVVAVREATGARSASPGTVPYQANTNRPRNNGSQVGTPLRRRSWHQINRMLEFQATHQDPTAPTNGLDGNSKH